MHNAVQKTLYQHKPPTSSPQICNCINLIPQTLSVIFTKQQYRLKTFHCQQFQVEAGILFLDKKDCIEESMSMSRHAYNFQKKECTFDKFLSNNSAANYLKIKIMSLKCTWIVFELPSHKFLTLYMQQILLTISDIHRLFISYIL